MWNTMVTIVVAEEERRDQLRAAAEWREGRRVSVGRQRSHWYGTLWNRLSLFPRGTDTRPNWKRMQEVGR